MTTKAIETSRLILRPPVAGDLDGWAGLDADGEAARFIGGVQTRSQSQDGLAQVDRMWAQRGASLFSVLERETGTWVGRVGPWIPEGHIGTEIGWAMARPFWGRGYAFEAAAAIMTWAFERLAWTEVIHCIDAPNLSSIALAERLGSRWLREDQEADGKVVQVYGQTREAWLGALAR
jgi:RimJ/RimL family protein N-acetyltransferase